MACAPRARPRRSRSAPAGDDDQRPAAPAGVELPAGVDAAELLAAIRTQQAALLSPVPRGEQRIEDPPHVMKPVIPEAIAEVVRGGRPGGSSSATLGLHFPPYLQLSSCI